MPDTNNSKPSLVTIESEIEKQAGQVIGKAMGAATDGAISMSGNILSGLFGDQIREWRTRNLIQQAAKTANYLDKMGVPLEKAKILPMGEIYALFENASKQDSESVSDMWSALLAKAMSPNENISIDNIYIDVLKSLGPAEAAIVKLMWDAELYFRTYSFEPNHPNGATPETERAHESNLLADEKRIIHKYKNSLKNALLNLMGLRVIYRPSQSDNSRNDYSNPNPQDRIFATYGYPSFVDASAYIEFRKELAAAIDFNAGLLETD